MLTASNVFAMSAAVLLPSAAFVLPLRNSLPTAGGLQHSTSSAVGVPQPASYPLAAAALTCAAAAALRRSRAARCATVSEDIEANSDILVEGTEVEVFVERIGAWFPGKVLEQDSEADSNCVSVKYFANSWCEDEFPRDSELIRIAKPVRSPRRQADSDSVVYSSFSAGATVILEEGEIPDSRGVRRPMRVARMAGQRMKEKIKRAQEEYEKERERDKQERIAAGVPPEAFDRKPNTKRILYNPDFDPSIQVGAMAPLGFFDPIGFTNKGDLNGFRNYRAAEIKHGRVAMMAALGAVVQHYVKFPGFESVPAGLGALTKEPGNVGFGVLLLVTGFLETEVWTQDEVKSPGDFGDPLGLGNIFKSKPDDYSFRERELNNGRFAMFAAIGIIFAELATGKDAVQQFGG
eukprot:TRINITY_DN8355_c0_g1_i2.p1 TRINITY_DN8355_c0_g1~~TRINITY_DN8355_c0_g1_i2.p1  ORF type:complete len:406 (+),score=65.76 TRINITY_DN8355_c0_g1_i2:29-1246(+)